MDPPPSVGPREQRQGAAAEPRAVAVAAPVAQAAPFPAEPAGSSTEAWEPAVPPAADTEAAEPGTAAAAEHTAQAAAAAADMDWAQVPAADRSAGTVAPADTGTEQAAAAAVVAAAAATAAAAAANTLAAAAAPAGQGSGRSSPCRLGCPLRETGN